MKTFTLNSTPQPIVPNDVNLANFRDVYITNTGAATATLQFDNDPNGSNSLGDDVSLSDGVGYLLASKATLPLVGYRPGSRAGSCGVSAVCSAGTTVVVQIVNGAKTTP